MGQQFRRPAEVRQVVTAKGKCGGPNFRLKIILHRAHHRKPYHYSAAQFIVVVLWRFADTIDNWPLSAFDRQAKAPIGSLGRMGIGYAGSAEGRFGTVLPNERWSRHELALPTAGGLRTNLVLLSLDSQCRPSASDREYTRGIVC